MNRNVQLAILLAVACATPLVASVRPAKTASARLMVSLDGSGWTVVGLQTGEGEKLGVNLRPIESPPLIATSVPNDVQLAIGLKDAYGQGADIVDINKREWWYARSFPSPEVEANQQARLVFDGVDYFADVWLNGEKLGSHEGAYTRFSFDITRRLRRQSNNYLAVRVTAPVKVPGRSQYEFMKGEFVNAEEWGALPGPGQWVFPLGLHRSVHLEITATTRLEEIQVATTALRDEQADLKIRVVVSSAGFARQHTLQLTIKPENFSGPALDLPPRTISFLGEVGESRAIEIMAEIGHPQLWWTWDQGSQNLYIAQATLLDAKGAVIDRQSSIFGIRMLERDDSLLYKLNGRPVFLRGAWYAMSRLFPADTSRWTYEKDLRLARNANMNSLVNFTVVEKDDFYDLADRLGILLFIELPWYQYGPMDALNARYPRRDEFLRWSCQEVAQIVRALGNHPSVGVWCPLSETTDGGQDFRGDFRITEAADGYRIFVKKIEEVVKKSDPDALYFPSFCDFGERHFWDGSWFPETNYDQHFEASAKFVSEYGAWSFFPLESIRRIIDPGEIWHDADRRWSVLNLPVNLKKLSYLMGSQYGALARITSRIEQNVDRSPGSFRDFVNDTQVYQAFLYGYAGDAYRRKLFAPINGLRSWMFKSFEEKPICELGVIDCFDTPMMAYYVEKRTFAPVTLSYAIRYALESVPPGSAWKVPVWISNATNRSLALNIESALFNLKGERVRHVSKDVSVEPRKATPVLELGWQLPEEPGVYLLRGRARSDKGTEAATEMYVKVVPRATRKVLRVLVLGTRDWAQPLADYLTNMGAVVTPVMPEPTVVRGPENPFPDSPEALSRNYDLIWLTGFNNYWREVPDEWSETILKAVESGVPFIHTGSWASFHGGVGWTMQPGVAALDLTPLAQLLPVEVEHENDVLTIVDQLNTGILPRPFGAARPTRIEALPAAPGWLKRLDFSGLSIENYHSLKPRLGAEVLLEFDDHPLLVTGRFGKGQTIAYLGFSPGGAKNYNSMIILDRALRSSAPHQLFAVICATLLALASGEEPLLPVNALLAARTTPLFETLKNTPASIWPEVSLSWTTSEESRQVAHLRIHNSASYFRGFRLRFKNADIGDDNLLPLWSEQFFDLLPGEVREATVEIFTADKRPVGSVALEAEAINRNDTRDYPVPAPPK